MQRSFSQFIFLTKDSITHETHKCNQLWLYKYDKNKHNIDTGDDIMFKVQNEFKNANVSRTVRFTESLFERLNETASRNDISFNLLVLQCCKYALDHQQTEDED